MDLKITLYTIIYGLPKAFRASKKTKRSFFSIYKEMVSLSSKYDVQLFEYMDHAIYKLNDIEREAAINIAKEKHEYAKLYDANMRFLVKYSKFKHQKSLKSRHKRREAYIKFYHMGKNCHIQYGVTFIFEHRRIGKLQIGSNCLFARNVDIDTTGDLTIGDDVKISEGAKILTHAHDILGMYDSEELIPFSNRAYNTPLTIGNNVVIASHAIIMPNVKTIGENAVISAGAVVVHPVAANTIVSGNPATVVGKIPKNMRIKTQEFKNISFDNRLKQAEDNQEEE